MKVCSCHGFPKDECPRRPGGINDRVAALLEQRDREAEVPDLSNPEAVEQWLSA